MYGNKNSGLDIAAEMFNLLNKSDSQVKVASDESGEKASPSLKAEAVMTPEDFLVSPEQDTQDVGAPLDSKIMDVSSYAEDLEAGEEEAFESPGMLLADDMYAADASYAEDVSYLVDARAKFMLEGLGKVAGSLRAKNESFAADLVEATAIGIKKDYLKEAEKKAAVMNTLVKMANVFEKEGNDIAKDMVDITIRKIKKES